MSEKQFAIQMTQGQPHHASLDVISRRLNFVAAIRKGLDQIQKGETLPHEQVKRELAT